MIYRVTQPSTVYVEALGRDVPMDPGQSFDDQIPEEALIIKNQGAKEVGELSRILAQIYDSFTKVVEESDLRIPRVQLIDQDL